MWHGPLQVEYLLVSGIAGEVLGAGASRWFAPGMRWRVAVMPGEARFELEIHADGEHSQQVPGPRRAEILRDAERHRVADVAGVVARAQALRAGASCIVEGSFDVAAAAARLWREGCFAWHPLGCRDGVCAVLLAHAERGFDLAEYLGRDHAVIEATLSGALAGDGEHAMWLHSTLARHLHIEEDVVFPAYLDAGGHRGWVDGLCREHRYLRQYLGMMSQEPSAIRRFLRLLDGHDEKEESVVYPDVLARLASRSEALLARVFVMP